MIIVVFIKRRSYEISYHPCCNRCPSHSHRDQIASRLFTAPVLEPNGSIAVCFATNLDGVARDLEARIIDSRGLEVTQTSSCGARLTSGVTCDSTAHFASNSALRCVVGTSGTAATLRGAMTTSTNGAFPFTGPANQTVPAQ